MEVLDSTKRGIVIPRKVVCTIVVAHGREWYLLLNTRVHGWLGYLFGCNVGVPYHYELISIEVSS
jgi:hypothetical protein